MMQETVVRTHGGLGITSFIMGVVSIFLIFGFFGLAGYISSGGAQTQQINVIAGAVILLLIGVCLLGIALGIGGAASRRSKKVFPVLGIIICTTILLVMCGIVALGLRIQGII